MSVIPDGADHRIKVDLFSWKSSIWEIIFLYAKRALKDKLRNMDILASVYSLSSLCLMKLHQNKPLMYHSPKLKTWRLLKKCNPSNIFSDFHLHKEQDKCPRIPSMFLANRITQLPGFLLLEVKTSNSTVKLAEAVSFSPELNPTPTSLLLNCTA